MNPATFPSEFRTDLARWQQLVRPAWLAGLMAGVAVAAAPEGTWRLIEVDCGAPDAFLRGHIPGAAYLDTHRLEDGPFWNKVADAALLQLLLDLGIAHDTTVILYGRSTTAAARAAHLMLYAGVRDVRLLDGGFAGWQRASLPLERGEPQYFQAASSFGADFPACPHYLMNLQQAKAHLLQPHSVLVSIRTRDEFIGKTSGYSYISARGDIAGARWGRAGDGTDVNNMSAFQWPDETMRPALEICAFWQAEGIHPGVHAAFYCGTGWRASVAFFYAWLMGWDSISVYDGGWFEWSTEAQSKAQSGDQSGEQSRIQATV